VSPLIMKCQITVPASRRPRALMMMTEPYLALMLGSGESARDCG